jgi:hypothetical protein
MVPFDNSQVLKAGTGSAKRQTASTGKEFERAHDLGLQKSQKPGR